MPEGASRGQAEHAALHLGFDDPASVAVWSPVDDVVMGGLSNSRLVHSGGHAEFTGSVSLANNGGFASVRTAALDYSAPGAEEVRVCARGDGRTYRLTLRTDDAPDGISWHAAFTPPTDAWAEIVLPLDAFRARCRGRPVAAPPLDPARIRCVGLLIADRQAGPFRLSLRWILAEKRPPGRSRSR
ncbi:CIA30 family protein [Accumulibacter sp.]|uniref:CIA30 family protein n=1 Tax=Accumulibacter sp. TaxID=2053492 RepID=UPI0025FE2B28|nr:CIA30 family protein [Accumulibacter sp.]MCM8596474.1 CIA30 family protein [Accumulibacter sp.]MCM8627354.1 CIA30 family protein [Accumulibacter sp.]MDS4050622.1 CIA30 family protein [Accumulibacter sp.]